MADQTTFRVTGVNTSRFPTVDQIDHTVHLDPSVKVPGLITVVVHWQHGRQPSVDLIRKGEAFPLVGLDRDNALATARLALDFYGIDIGGR